jgi:nucleotide-binding universal stress UspA family protein
MTCVTGKYSLFEVSNKNFSNKAAVLESRSDLLPFATKDVRQIVVPLDGTLEAEHALPYAIAIARRSGASICLVHVLPLREAVRAWEVSDSAEIGGNGRHQKHGYMSALLNSVRSITQGKVSDDVIEETNIAGTLSTMADENSLVIMASAGRSYMKELLNGSVTDNLLRKLKGPLLLIRGLPVPPDLSNDPIPRHIMIPLDGTACAEQTIVPTMQFGALGGARYSLINLRTALAHRREISVSQEYLKDVACRFSRLNSRFDAEVVVSYRDLATDLLEHAEKEGADWIALTSHSRQFWDRLLHHSVAKDIIRKSKVPLLLFGHPFKPDTDCDQLMIRGV